MRTDPATQFLAEFVEQNKDVLDDKIIDPETGQPRMRLPAGDYSAEDTWWPG